MLLRHIRYFLAVAQHRNFTRAAEALHVSQPTLSQQIRQLEATLNVQLLDRSGRKVALTDAGHAYARFAQRALQELEEGKQAIHDVHDLSRGTLRLATTPTFTAYLIGPLLEKYNSRYPNIVVDVTEMTQDTMERLLADDALDLGIAFDDVRSADIEIQKLFVEPFGLIVGKSHPRAKNPVELTIRDLEKEALVLLNEEFATRQHIDRYFKRHHVSPRIAVQVNSIAGVIQIVRSARVATLLPSAAVHANRDLCLVDIKPALPSRVAALLLRKDAYRSAAASAFIKLAHEAYGGRYARKRTE
ncbi:MAG TPA: transcriptional regulator CynR [Pararobbsia sp.]|nr:transcriptional regulator CynR [Pararobbsia sp.]